MSKILNWLTQKQQPDVPARVTAYIEEARESRAPLLDLSGENLTELPESLGQLTELQYLNLSLNQLTELPEFIGQLTQLRVLVLSHNQLTALPESLGKLAELTWLYLDDNRLTGLPESLRKLHSLEGLSLHGNSALGLPSEVLGVEWQDFNDLDVAKPAEILDYYFRVRGGVRRPLNEAKLILLGRGAVGKTSLVNRLIHNKFKLGEEKTEGIRITEWPLRLNGQEDVRLNVWDFGGQEIMHATHQFFLTQRSLYLLVLNGREGGEDAVTEWPDKDSAWRNVSEGIEKVAGQMRHYNRLRPKK